MLIGVNLHAGPQGAGAGRVLGLRLRDDLRDREVFPVRMPAMKRSRRQPDFVRNLDNRYDEPPLPPNTITINYIFYKKIMLILCSCPPCSRLSALPRPHAGTHPDFALAPGAILPMLRSLTRE